MGATRRVRKRFERLWEEVARPMGMAWWEITITFSTDRERFMRPNDNECLMICNADWRYGMATIDVNVGRADETNDEALEEYCVHEMMHILVNEMRQKEDCLAHEERVVTGLTKAFMWMRDHLKEGP